MSFPDQSFDAVYAIEATVHAPSLEGIYSEIFRVLKPGGVFGVYEWLMTDAYDESNPEHRQIRLDIEHGDGISNMEKVEVALAAMKAAGFVMEHNEDMAIRDDPAPWYWPLSGELKYINTLGDVPTILRMTKPVRWMIHRTLGFGESIGIIPPGTAKTADGLAIGGDALVKGAREKLFTPMYLMVGRKPKA
jgi:sterol 24-C-methyltransferase